VPPSQAVAFLRLGRIVCSGTVQVGGHPSIEIDMAISNKASNLDEGRAFAACSGYFKELAGAPNVGSCLPRCHVR